MGKPRRRRSGAKARAAEPDRGFWEAPAAAPAAPPLPVVVAAPDPTVVLRSLGTLPQPVHPQVSAAQLAATYEKAAQMAIAVATAAGLAAQ